MTEGKGIEQILVHQLEALGMSVRSRSSNVCVLVGGDASRACAVRFLRHAMHRGWILEWIQNRIQGSRSMFPRVRWGEYLPDGRW